MIHFRCPACPSKGGVLLLSQIKEHIAIAHTTKQKDVQVQALTPGNQEPHPGPIQEILTGNDVILDPEVANNSSPELGDNQEVPVFNQTSATSELIQALDLNDQVNAMQIQEVQSLVHDEASCNQGVEDNNQSRVIHEAATFQVLEHQENASDEIHLFNDEEKLSVKLPQTITRDAATLQVLEHQELSDEIHLPSEEVNLSIVLPQTVTLEAATFQVLEHQEHVSDKIHLPNEEENMSVELPQTVTLETATEENLSVLLPQTLFFFLCPICYDEGVLEQGTFNPRYTGHSQTRNIQKPDCYLSSY